MKVYKYTRREKRKRRIRGKISGTAERPRLSVFRSNKYIYAQLIDDEASETLLAVSDLVTAEDAEEDLSLSTLRGSQRFQQLQGKRKSAYELGWVLAKKALKENIKKVVFDRGGYKYHGRVKSLAQGAREGGLEF